MQELAVLLLNAEAHDVLYARPVVPATIERHDLAGPLSVVDVAMEVPVTSLALARRVCPSPRFAGT
jgi:hypothetical protein